LGYIESKQLSWVRYVKYLPLQGLRALKTPFSLHGSAYMASCHNLATKCLEKVFKVMLGRGLYGSCLVCYCIFLINLIIPYYYNVNDLILIFWESGLMEIRV
jgi:hypothetical protein